MDVPPGTGLFSLGAIQFELQQTLGIPVDVLTLNDLPVRLRDSVAREARPL
ncbi:MAG: nucleotidyltransferase family protein [Rhodanobacteraceae bacterium]